MKPLPGRMTAAAVLVCGLLAAGTGVAGLIVASHTGRGLLQPGRPAVIPAPAGPVSAPARGPATATAVRRPPDAVQHGGGWLVHRQLAAGRHRPGGHRRAHRLLPRSRGVLPAARAAPAGPGLRAARGRDAGRLPGYLGADVPQGPLPDRGRLRADAWRAAAAGHLRRRVRSRPSLLPEQRRGLCRGGPCLTAPGGPCPARLAWSAGVS